MLSSSSLLPSSFFFVVIVIIVVFTISIIPTSEAELLGTIIGLFDTPHSMLLNQQQYAAANSYSSGLYSAVDKTREFLAFGDAALDYYIN
eukprot:CAMPEP_0170852000 /NCGR_PEP_ID=MMETSP0734-20130129/11590_1 /TAXON_ID=186038 /ORGANISM="Fragilariopsis kerguelensis, Strain L26-C5" /LENGTH=89 /DNA_ID=CAMNT_0011222271 /DNA_START=48 /DNA_END=317 /DNA_ORIENTATION=-